MPWGCISCSYILRPSSIHQLLTEFRLLLYYSLCSGSDNAYVVYKYIYRLCSIPRVSVLVLVLVFTTDRLSTPTLTRHSESLLVYIILPLSLSSVPLCFLFFYFTFISSYDRYVDLLRPRTSSISNKKIIFIFITLKTWWIFLFYLIFHKKIKCNFPYFLTFFFFLSVFTIKLYFLAEINFKPQLKLGKIKKKIFFYYQSWNCLKRKDLW